MSGAAESGNLVAELVGDDVDPTQQITPDDLKSLSMTKVIVDQNYIDLNVLADGDLYNQETDGHTNVAEPTYSSNVFAIWVASVDLPEHGRPINQTVKLILLSQ